MEYIDKSPLFKNLEKEEIEVQLAAVGAVKKFYEKDSYLFVQEDYPEKLYVLVEGSVAVSNIEEDGKRTIVNIFKKSGTVFGEVYVFMENRMYDYSCVALKDSVVLEIPKEEFLDYKNWDEPFVKVMIRNMINVLSQKAFYLNTKNLILSELTLRQKLMRFFQQNEQNGKVILKYNREELADYLGTTRPSVSREINKMKKEGLIDVRGKIVYLLKKGEDRDE